MASLSLDERRAIVFGAMSVYERTAAFLVSGRSSSDSDSPIRPDANASLQNWSRVFSPGDREAFIRRLHWDGLDWTTVGKALSDTSIGPDPDADWTTWLDLILESAAALKQELAAEPPSEKRYFEPEDEPPFIEFAVAGVRAARVFLLKLNPDAYATLTDPARQAIERQLAKELAIVGERTYYELFRKVLETTPEGAEGAAPAAAPGDDARYRAFIYSML